MELYRKEIDSVSLSLSLPLSLSLCLLQDIKDDWIINQINWALDR